MKNFQILYTERNKDRGKLVRLIGFTLILIGFFATNYAFGQVGEQLTDWKDGYLDIHAINTGGGESTFFIFPDGTTLLVDAGAHLNTTQWAAEPKPNSSRQPGEWIARYIRHMTHMLPEQKLNYMLPSHFHWDHMGGVNDEMERSESGKYILSGITEVGDLLPIDKIIDRGWPDYNWPVPLDDAKMINYKAFLDWQIENNELAVEKIQVGTNNQIVLKHHPEEYPGFEVRNIAANGLIWTGFGDNAKSYFPSLDDLEKENYPSENYCSIALRISYGKFDYFTGGDISFRGAQDVGGPQWKDIETPIARATGPVDVLKANHHANYDANGVEFLRILRPRVITIHTWGASQPAMSVYRRMISTQTYSGPRDLFVTNLMEATKVIYNTDEVIGQNGHIVIRVAPEGEEYMVYVLDDSNEKFEIKSVHGPYESN